MTSLMTNLMTNLTKNMLTTGCVYVIMQKLN